ncbi:14428_t:CDS:2, partial [Ambispora leptoticha]
KIVEAKVGKQKVNCHLEPGFLGPSMCSDKLLKKIGGKISRKLTPKEKDSKFIREKTTSPLGLAIIPLTFTSNIINNHHLSNCQRQTHSGYRSITIPTETYLPEIVIDAKNAFVRTTLHIKDLRTKKKPRINVSVNKRDIHDFYKSLSGESDSSDSSDSDSGNSSTSSSEIEVIHMHKTEAVGSKSHCCAIRKRPIQKRKFLWRPNNNRFEDPAMLRMGDSFDKEQVTNVIDPSSKFRVEWNIINKKESLKLVSHLPMNFKRKRKMSDTG